MFKKNFLFSTRVLKVCEKFINGLGFKRGSIITICSFMFARKCVSKIILLRGGKSVYIETYGLFGLGKKHTIELKKLNCSVSRVASRGYVPIKRTDKGIFVDYLLDNNSGHYPDPFLFDMTAGIQRIFKNKK